MKFNNLSSSFKQFKNNLNYTLLCSAFISAIILILYVIAAAILTTVNFDNMGILEISIFLLFIFALCGIIIPFLYSYFACNTILNSPQRDAVKFSSFLKTVPLAIRYPQKGQLNTWNNLLVAALIYILTSFVFSIIIYLSLYNLDQSFKEVFDGLTTIVQNNASFVEIAEYYSKYSSYFELPNLISNFAALFFGVYYFLHNILVNIFKYLLSPALGTINNKIKSVVFKVTIKEHKKEFYKNYYSVSFILIIIYMIIMPLSYFGLNALGINGMSNSLLSLSSVSITLLFLLPFVPLVFNLYGNIWFIWEKYFLANFVKLAKSNINLLKHEFGEMNANQSENLKMLEKDVAMIEEHLKETSTKEENNDNKKNDE